MFEKNNSYKLLKVFLDNPLENFRLRELARLSGISPASVINYLSEFIKQNLIKKYEKRGIPFYQAERDNEKFIFYKKVSILYELQSSGLVDFLWDKISPHAIILYGSFAKGESIEDSDIDIYLIAKEKKLDLRKFEKIFNRKIHLMYSESPKKIPEKLKTNLVNGIVLKGYFDLE